MRSFLTMLGIIIGVASVITMLAIGQGSKASIQKQIAEMGSNMIMIHPGADRGPGGARMSADDMETLTLDDYKNIAEQNKYLAAVSPNVSSSGQAIFGNNNYQTSVTGVNQDYLTIRQLTVESGDMFSDADINAAAKVCVVGKTIVDNLFPNGGDPIGQVIRFNKIPMRIVGVLKSKGYNCSLINARFVKPIDTDILDKLSHNHRLFVTMEENVESGGYGEKVLDYVYDNNIDAHVIRVAIPDEYVEHGNVDVLKASIGIDDKTIVDRIIAYLNGAGL